MSGELRALTSGYVCGVLAMIALLWASSPSNVIVAAVGFGAAIIGSAVWLVIVEHQSLATLLRRDAPTKALRRLEFLAILAGSFAFMIIGPDMWPSHLPVDRQGVPITQGETYFDHLVDIPENAASSLILGMAVYVFSIALGRMVLTFAADARRALRGMRPRHQP